MCLLMHIRLSGADYRSTWYWDWSMLLIPIKPISIPYLYHIYLLIYLLKQVQIIEAHGTGTGLGDPIEVAALAAVYKRRVMQKQADTHTDTQTETQTETQTQTDTQTQYESVPLLLTSVKANLGHMEEGAGMAGLFSLILALQHGLAPPNGQLTTVNDKVRTMPCLNTIIT
jgi:3-oxoacyl-(acyl-carrier-protein) synthase